MNCEDWAVRLMRAAYGPDAAATGEPAPPLELPLPLHEGLQRAARRIGRNALGAAELTTDSHGVPLVDGGGQPLSRLWSFAGGGRWLSVFSCPAEAPQQAVEAWAEWAARGGRTPRLALLETDVPLIAPGPFAVAPTPRPRLHGFASHDAAEHHAAVLSIVETCRLQGRDPVAFLAALLTQA